MTELMKELTLMQSAVAQMEETLDDKLQVTGVSMDAEAETLEEEMASQEEKQTSLEDAFRSQVVTEDEKNRRRNPRRMHRSFLCIKKA